MSSSHSSHFHSSPDDSASAAPTLYCEEAVGEIVQFVSDSRISDRRPQSSPFDDYTLNRLIDSELHFLPLSDYFHRCRDRFVDATARQDSINWILKVRAYYHFRPVTVLLSINYFDRFLSSHSLPANGWPFQLLSVACLSLAAKMEEVHVPLLLDLQILEPGFVFEPKTVQRMELHVMANLNWRLRSVTPFDYLDYFISKLHFTEPDSFYRVFTDSSDLILSTTRVIDFLCFPPSTIAAAAVLCAAGESFQIPPADGQLFHEKINKEMVRSCHQLMQEYLIDTCPSASLKDSTAEPSSAPASPVGVLDAAACRSCDTRSENPISVSQVEAHQQLAKRPRSSTPDVQ
ncbi:cyclin-D1-1-like [Euphorbia lathyris]|uniref:cyclin-D1-1-like n=1 Tax=Euphorbia lathyris TaxID=212925 RepID=UPI003313D939